MFALYSIILKSVVTRSRFHMYGFYKSAWLLWLQAYLVDLKICEEGQLLLTAPLVGARPDVVHLLARALLQLLDHALHLSEIGEPTRTVLYQTLQTSSLASMHH